MKKTTENRTTTLWNKRRGSPRWVLIASSLAFMAPGSAKARSPEAQRCIDAATAHLYLAVGGTKAVPVTPRGARDFPTGVVVGAVQMRDVITYAEAVAQGDKWAHGDPHKTSYCLRFQQTIHFQHPFAHRGSLGITQRVPIHHLHPDDMHTLRNATQSSDDDALLKLFQWRA